MSFKFKRAEDSPGLLLWQLTNQWQRLQREALAKLHITHPQFVVLACILWLSLQSDDSITQAQVSALSKIDKMSMSDLVKTLITKKLLRRAPHKQDKRAHALSLTTQGKKVISNAVPIVEKIDAKFFSKESTELMQFLSCLKHLSQ